MPDLLDCLVHSPLLSPEQALQESPYMYNPATDDLINNHNEVELQNGRNGSNDCISEFLDSVLCNPGDNSCFEQLNFASDAFTSFPSNDLRGFGSDFNMGMNQSQVSFTCRDY